MFEDRTEENILNELLERIKEVNTNEGSFIHAAESSNAATWQEVYVAFRYFYKQLCISSMDLEHLIERGNEIGLYYKYATFATYKALFSCEMEIGDIFTKNDITFVITENTGLETIDDVTYYTYTVTAQTAGTVGNNSFGTFDTFLGVNENYNGDGKIYELLVAAENDEERETYRTRLSDKCKSQEFSGNLTSYVSEISKIQGVAGVKPIPRTNIDDAWTYKIYILASGGKVPSSTLIENIQNIIDPSTDVNNLSGIYGLPELESTSGKGYGIAPADHVVVIQGVESQQIDVQLDFEYSAGYSFDNVKAEIESIVENYLDILVNSETDGWQKSSELVVKRSEISSLIVQANIPGINDVTTVTVGNNATTVTVPYTHIPVRGVVSECSSE